MVEPRPVHVKAVGYISRSNSSHTGVAVEFVRDGVNIYDIPVIFCVVPRTTKKLVKSIK